MDSIGQDSDFDPSSIFSSQPVYLRKQVYYQGHACATYSVEHSNSVIEYIRRRFNSPDCIPYALRLVEGSQVIALNGDNGEFLSGVILSNALKKLEGYNVLVMVTRHVTGCFVVDMVQNQKRNFIKVAAEKAIEQLKLHLQGQSVNTAPSILPNNSFDLQVQPVVPQITATISLESDFRIIKHGTL